MTDPLYFRVQYTRGGAFCGLKVWFGVPNDPDTGEPLDRSPRWQVEFNGKPYDDPDRFLLYFNPDGQPVIKGERTTAAEYKYLSTLHQWATQYDPNAPAAKPHEKIDHLKGDLIF